MSYSHPHANPYSDALANDLSDYNDWRLTDIAAKPTTPTTLEDQRHLVVNRWREHYLTASEVAPCPPLPDALKSASKWIQDRNKSLFSLMSAMPEFPGHPHNTPDLDHCWLCKFYEFEIKLINWDASLSNPASIMYLVVTAGSTTSHIRLADATYYTFCDLNFNSTRQMRLSRTLQGSICLRCANRYHTATGHAFDDTDWETH